MTCICGVKKGNTVYLGGDSAATAGDMSQTIIGEPKVFVHGNVGIGFCGLPKAMDALQHSFKAPVNPRGLDSRSYVSSVLVPAIEECLDQRGLLDDGCFEGELLVGYDGGLYRVQSNLQVLVPRADHAAIGSGADPALGSLHAVSGDPKGRVIRALEASANNNASVRPPYVVISVRGR